MKKLISLKMSKDILALLVSGLLFFFNLNKLLLMKIIQLPCLVASLRNGRGHSRATVGKKHPLRWWSLNVSKETGRCGGSLPRV